jgi:uncharacterized membrane protein YhaH (DUF805 family)
VQLIFVWFSNNGRLAVVIVAAVFLILFVTDVPRVMFASRRCHARSRTKLNMRGAGRFRQIVSWEGRTAAPVSRLRRPLVRCRMVA